MNGMATRVPAPESMALPALPATSRVPRSIDSPALLTTSRAAGALASAASLAFAAASAAFLAAILPATAEPSTRLLVAFAVTGAAWTFTFSTFFLSSIAAFFVCLPTSRSGLVNSCMSRFICQLA